MSQSILSAAEYHRITSYNRFRMTPHHLDWDNQPRLDKAYPPLDKRPLDRHPAIPTVNYLELVQRAGSGGNSPARPLDPDVITSLFYLTQVITARSMHGNQPFYYRSVASAGALYPFELYLVVHRVYGMAPGVYHYDLFNFSFNVLRNAPVPVVPPSGFGIAATIYIGGIFFRSAWKYRDRAYRYVLLDAGHLIENLRLALSALGLAFSMELDFDDDATGVLLGLDSTREVCLACVHVMDGTEDQDKTNQADEIAPLPSDIRNASRVSMKETVYRQMALAHQAGYAAINATDDHPSGVDGLGGLPELWQPLPSTHPSASMDYGDVLRQRRSRRNFIPAALDDGQWSGVLELIAAAVKNPASPWVSPAIGILAGEGMPIPPGFYIFDPHGRRLGRVVAGDFMESMATACLEQMWLKNAAFHLLFITDPAALDHQFGARAYRHVMIEAGRLGQQAYLAATALGLGACGIGAIYDREAADLLALSDTGALIYLVGIGPVKKNKTRH